MEVSNTKATLKFEGLDTNNDVVSKYVIEVNLDETLFDDSQSNLKITITSLETHALKAGSNITIGEDNSINAVVPEKLSQLQNDTYYQTKTEVENIVNNKLDTFQSISYTVVDSVDEVTESGTIYLIPNNEPQVQTFALDSNTVMSYLQYIFDSVNNTAVQLGSTSDINLEGYVTDEELTTSIADAVAGITQFDVKIPSDGQLPTVGIKGTIYFIPSESGDGFYDEYLWVDGTYTKIGTTSINFANYVDQEQFSAELAKKANKTDLNALATNSALAETNAQVALKADKTELTSLATKEEVGAKQDKLVAGSNIRINDNVISATGEILNEVDFANITGDIATNPQLQEEFNKKVNEDDLIELTSEQVDDIWNEVVSA